MRRSADFPRALAAIAACGVVFEDTRDGTIRAFVPRGESEVGVCPICAAANEQVGDLRWALPAWSASEGSGLHFSKETIDRIAAVADGRPEIVRGDRRRVRLACGLGTTGKG